MYYWVVEGEQPFATLCAVLYQGELGRDLTVMLAIQNSSLGDTGTYFVLKFIHMPLLALCIIIIIKLT